MKDAAAAIAELDRLGVVTVAAKRADLRWALIGAIAFTALGVVALLVHGAGWRIPSLRLGGALAIAFFGVIGIPTLAVRLRTADRAVRLDARGVELGGGTSAAWSEVTSASLVSIGTSFVALRTDVPPRNPLVRLGSRCNAMMLGRGPRARRGRYAIPLPVDLDLPPADLLRVVQHARRLAG